MMIDGYILTGGAASRMGSDKAVLRIGGVTLVERVAAAMSPVVREVFTVGGRAGSVLLADVPDYFPDDESGERVKSSLAGLITALRHARSEWIVVTACDMPFVTTELFAKLAEMRAREHGSVVPVSSEGITQPLCGIYHAAACMAAAEEAFREGRRSLQRLLDQVNARRVPFNIFEPLAGAEHFFTNVNTPDELAAAEITLLKMTRPEA